MKIKVWRCELCASPCILPFDPEMYDDILKEYIAPDTCPYEGYGIDTEYQLIEIEATELIKYFASPCKNYFLTQMCEARGGICPKECDGNVEVCMQNVGVQRSIRK